MKKLLLIVSVFMLLFTTGCPSSDDPPNLTKQPITIPDNNPNPVPEPATMLLLGIGIGALGIYGRKRKK